VTFLVCVFATTFGVLPLSMSLVLEYLDINQVVPPFMIRLGLLIAYSNLKEYITKLVIYIMVLCTNVQV
jgi:E3 ubiquitin-protein ligase DOA10